MCGETSSLVWRCYRYSPDEEVVGRVRARGPCRAQHLTALLVSDSQACEGVPLALKRAYLGERMLYKTPDSIHIVLQDSLGRRISE